MKESPDFNVKAFRRALGSFPTGVAVVTAMAETVPVGITINSFTSVSLEPPLVLWCLNKTSQRYQLFAEADAFTINILDREHEGVSSRLAKRGEHSLLSTDVVGTELGPPALANAHAVFECSRHFVQSAGDHDIVIGLVHRFAHRDEGAPLVFYRGSYGALSA